MLASPAIVVDARWLQDSVDDPADHGHREQCDGEHPACACAFGIVLELVALGSSRTTLPPMSG